jgi:hypothetical protein
MYCNDSCSDNSIQEEDDVFEDMNALLAVNPITKEKLRKIRNTNSYANSVNVYVGRPRSGKTYLALHDVISIVRNDPNTHLLVYINENGECVAKESVRTPKKALARTCEIVKEMIGDRDPKDYILFHVYTGTSMLDTLLPIEEKYGLKTNHEAVIMSPVSGSHNGPWLAGYGLLFLRREDEPLED